MMDDSWEDFKLAARLGHPRQTPVALIVDSPWLPGYAGIDTRDYFLFQDCWLKANLDLLQRFPGVVWIPGFWVEYGMAAEPSAFGAKLRFYSDRPPSVEPISQDLSLWDGLKPADPHEDGLMPLAIRLYQAADQRLQAEGLGIKMVAARGPMTVASWLSGITPLMLEIAINPGRVASILDAATTTIIRWLHAQLDALRDPQGILLLDDVVGMVSRKHYERLVWPQLQRIFDEFNGLVRVYHNDTPCMHLVESLPKANFDVFNFSHEMDLAEVRARTKNQVALMGNVPPLEVGVRGTPEETYQWACRCLQKGGPSGMILSFGGGVSPGAKPENIDALLRAACDSAGSGGEENGQDRTSSGLI
ncbi:MAG: uroporphyrinogen decarboxylase [Chloroflexota bacterium]|nr:MAG: uroporphyrinogen decarboxylase [Chloroflexota bacterium]